MPPRDRDFPLDKPRRQPSTRARHYGVHPAEVVEVVDPEGQGRVRVSLPWAAERGQRPPLVWARVATLMAGAGRGSWFIPDPGDEVLVAFEAGDLDRPYMVGALWNDRDRPPEKMDGQGSNEIKTLRSRSGVRITFDDSTGGEKLTLETPGGHSLQLDDDAGRIDITDSHGNRLRLDATGVTVQTPGEAKVEASMVEVTTGQLTVNAGLSNFSGVVKCDTIIANSVIGGSYTPGPGNLA